MIDDETAKLAVPPVLGPETEACDEFTAFPFNYAQVPLA
jgi:hypothetical protein